MEIGRGFKRERWELEVARGDAEYMYRMPPDVAVRPAAAHLRSALLCFSSQLFESAEQVHASLHIEYRVLASLFTGGITPLVDTVHFNLKFPV